MSQIPSQILPTPSGTPGSARSHRYVIEYFTKAGRRLGPVAVEPDFQAAREWAHFEGLRRGLLPPLSAPATGTIDPLWSEDQGPPYCRGVRVVLETPEGGREVSSEVPITYFRELAARHASGWVTKGELEAGDRYRYNVCAYPTAASAVAPEAEGAFRVEVLAEPLPLTESPLDAFLARGELVGDDPAGDAPVFIHRAVLEETRARAQEAGEVETGGVLVGRLHRDAQCPEIFLEIEVQIPAQHAEATGSSFGFTPETWAAAHAALALRGEGALMLGWWHSHPRFCRNCPEERRRACVFAKPFFSGEDVHLHRTCFPQAYQVALLISDLPEAGPSPALFGWRTGRVTPRSYYAVP